MRIALSSLVVLGAVIGCGGAGNDAGVPGEAHLILAWDGSREPATLDGHVEPYQPGWLIDSFIADPLVVLGPNGDYIAGLALDWTSSEDARTWTFTLREGVSFQDGTPFDAAAVKYNVERILAPETQSAEMAAHVGPVARVEILDDQRVVLHYEVPWVTVLDAFRRVPIWSPTAAEKWGLAEFHRHLIGTGPFLLDEWVPNDHVTLVKWSDYGGWNAISRGGPAHLDRVTIRFIGEQAVLGNVVKTGDAHIAMNVPSTYIEDYRDSDDFRLITGFQAGSGLSMTMNTRNPPLSHLELRQALLYGVNQEAINELLYDGNFLVTDGPLNEIHPCYWEGNADYYPHDPDKAAALLEGMGYVDRDGDGIREAHGVDGVADEAKLELRWTVLHYSEIGEAVQSQWRDLGIDLNVEVIPGPVQLERVNQRNFDLMYERQRSPDPMLLDMVWNSAHDVVGGWAWGGFVDAELDATVGQLRTVADPKTRCEIAKRAQKIIMDNALMLPTLSEPIFYAVSNRVVDFELSSEGQFFFLHNTRLEP